MFSCLTWTCGVHARLEIRVPNTVYTIHECNEHSVYSCTTFEFDRSTGRLLASYDNRRPQAASTTSYCRHTSKCINFSWQCCNAASVPAFPSAIRITTYISLYSTSACNSAGSSQLQKELFNNNKKTNNQHPTLTEAAAAATSRNFNINSFRLAHAR